MRRRPFTLLSAASLLACVLTCACWVRSYWRVDRIGRPNGSYVDGVESSRGSLWIRHRLDVDAGAPLEWDFWPLPNGGEPGRDEDGDGIADDGFWELTWTPPEPNGPLGLGYFDRDTVRVHNSVVWASGSRRITPAVEQWRVLIVPYWVPVVVTAMLPLRSVAAALGRRRRRRAGHCPACGYDLRASPGRCSECGTVPTALAARG